jgi:hypothetical protein
VADTEGPEQDENASGADRARADAEWDAGNAGGTWHDLAGDQQTPPRPYRRFRVSPRRSQTWREVDEMPDRELMREGRWFV